ncbi:uncharacterized protein LOC122871972 isoform X4 [Siniperca chuatsi]|uniref:uncharacterized protein LOC122871972 isoform X4 n=1 Tax=Siniperca chuatsi TaxID=119488 RepID=UPI001CE20A28|nr:uncharacterized protein LOC122871972 isoform X4 [Siniperca chuatsi]
MSGGAGRCADLRLEGAKTEEVAPMNGPTVNLHLLTVSHADTERDSENRGLPGGDREGGRLHRCGDVQDYTGQLFNMAAITEEGNINTCRYHEGSQLTHTNASTIIHIEDRTQILETSRQPSTTLNLRLLMNRPRPRAPFTFSLGAFISSLWVLDFKIHSVRIEPTTSEPPRSPLPPGDTEPGRYFCLRSGSVLDSEIRTGCCTAAVLPSPLRSGMSLLLRVLATSRIRTQTGGLGFLAFFTLFFQQQLSK